MQQKISTGFQRRLDPAPLISHFDQMTEKSAKDREREQALERRAQALRDNLRRRKQAAKKPPATSRD